MPSETRRDSRFSASLDWVIPGAAAFMAVSFILSSYPMMRPGFDVWWHLGMVAEPSSAKSSMFHGPRIFWHYTWHTILELFGIFDVFSRALVIHRTQFMLSSVLLCGTAYFIIRSAVGLSISRSMLFALSIYSGCIWFLMHGTRSVAHDRGVDSAVTQSWILWYSVNYQISLLFSLFASALTLYLFSNPQLRPSSVAAALGVVVSLAMVFLIHMAELVNYILLLALLCVLFIRGRRGLAILTALVLGVGIAVSLALTFSYRSPKFIVETKGGVYSLLTSLLTEGSYLTEGGGTRIETGWTVLHAVSLVSLAVGLLIFSLTARDWTKTSVRYSAVLFVIFSAAIPLALYTNVGAGLFSFLTHRGIAWRFALSSLLFVGIPLGSTLVVLSRNSQQKGAILAITALSTFLLCMAFLIEAGLKGKDGPNRLFAVSLVNSLDPHSVFFGISREQRQYLTDLATRLKRDYPNVIVCTDIFTSYYLFFIQGYKSVALPVALTDVPGYMKAKPACRYPKNSSWLWSRTAIPGVYPGSPY